MGSTFAKTWNKESQLTSFRETRLTTEVNQPRCQNGLGFKSGKGVSTKLFAKFTDSSIVDWVLSFVR